MVGVSVNTKEILKDDSNFMADLETLDTGPRSIILSIGVVQFGSNGLGKEFYAEVDYKSCVNAGLTQSIETVIWHMEQSDRVKETLKACVSGRRARLNFCLTQLQWFIGYTCGIDVKDVKIWGNGSDFDNVILANAYKAVELDPPWLFYNNRCYRTAKNILAGPKLERSGTHHNALDDAKSQALHLIELVNHSKQNEPRN